MMNAPLLIGLREASASLGLSHWTLRKYIREGSLEAVRIGRRVLLEPHEIARLIRSGKQDSQND